MEDNVIKEVMNDLHNRSIKGISKYNTTLDRTDIDLKGWLQHAYEEALDMANYLKRSILEIQSKDE
jgi:dihydroorotate dehydrogenase